MLMSSRKRFHRARGMWTDYPWLQARRYEYLPVTNRVLKNYSGTGEFITNYLLRRLDPTPRLVHGVS